MAMPKQEKNRWSHGDQSNKKQTGAGTHGQGTTSPANQANRAQSGQESSDDQEWNRSQGQDFGRRKDDPNDDDRLDDE